MTFASKEHFAFILAGSVALVAAPSARATIYLTHEQAQQVLFPGVALTEAPLQITKDQRRTIEAASGVKLDFDDFKAWRSAAGDWLIIDRVLGKHEFITYAVRIDHEGIVKGVEILEYRETYGHEIRNAKWRAQFAGKTKDAPLKLDKDIRNLSGATLSSRHITDGVKRLLFLYDIVLRMR